MSKTSPSKTEMVMGYFRTKKDALQSSKDFRKGSMNDIMPELSLFYRVKKRPGKNKPGEYKYTVIRTARRKSKSSIKRAKKNRDNFYRGKR